jgi:hypothetical protein
MGHGSPHSGWLVVEHVLLVYSWLACVLLACLCTPGLLVYSWLVYSWHMTRLPHTLPLPALPAASPSRAMSANSAGIALKAMARASSATPAVPSEHLAAATQWPCIMR